MARQIVVLDVDSDELLNITCAFWLAVPAALVRPAPSLVSAVPTAASGVSWGITTTELAALQAGTVRELVETLTMPVGSTAAQAEAIAQKAYSDQLASLASRAPSSRWIGASWDGTTWTAAP